MSYIEKYNRNKCRLLDEIKNTFSDNEDLIRENEIKINEIEFKSLRDQDDFLEIQFSKASVKFNVKFILPMTKDFVFQDSEFLILYYGSKGKGQIRFNELYGNCLKEKIATLIRDFF